jgi:oxygen-independent coproporphyrinogen-3 oxidase
VQSLDDAMLAMLGRIHSADEARAAVSMARSAGFDNIGIDLMHSLPGQTLAHWEKTLADAIALGPDHVSAYGLTLEEGTSLHELHERGGFSLPDEETTALMYEAAMDLLPAAGFEQYEIANFARPGYRSGHNQVYWQRGNYLGLGAAAHSFLNSPGYGRRWHNPADIGEYCRLVSAGILPAVDDMELSRQDAMGEALFLGLRRLEGVDSEAFRSEFGVTISDAFPGAVERHLANGLLEMGGGRLWLSRRGLLLANRVFAEFA